MGEVAQNETDLDRNLVIVSAKRKRGNTANQSDGTLSLKIPEFREDVAVFLEREP